MKIYVDKLEKYDFGFERGLFDILLKFCMKIDKNLTYNQNAYWCQISCNLPDIPKKNPLNNTTQLSKLMQDILDRLQIRYKDIFPLEKVCNTVYKVPFEDRDELDVFGLLNNLDHIFSQQLYDELHLTENHKYIDIYYHPYGCYFTIWERKKEREPGFGWKVDDFINRECMRCLNLDKENSRCLSKNCEIENMYRENREFCRYIISFEEFQQTIEILKAEGNPKSKIYEEDPSIWIKDCESKKDWTCSKCGYFNLAQYTNCFRCYSEHQ